MPNGTITLGPIDDITYTLEPDGSMTAKLTDNDGQTHKGSITLASDGTSVTKKVDETVITKLTDGK